MSVTSRSLFFLIPLVACTSSDDPTKEETMDIDSFRVVDQIAGWQENSFTEFDASTMFELINGGAQPHVDNGLVEGFVQSLTSTSARELEVYVEDFDSAAGTLALYQLQTDGMGTTIDLPSFDDGTAMAGRVLGGAVVYAHWDHVYASMTLTNYPSSEPNIEQKIVADVETFLEHYSGLTQ